MSPPRGRVRYPSRYPSGWAPTRLVAVGRQESAAWSTWRAIGAAADPPAPAPTSITATATHGKRGRDVAVLSDRRRADGERVAQSRRRRDPARARGGHARPLVEAEGL